LQKPLFSWNPLGLDEHHFLSIEQYWETGMTSQGGGIEAVLKKAQDKEQYLGPVVRMPDSAIHRIVIFFKLC
jgi:hypothetical protein